MDINIRIVAVLHGFEKLKDLKLNHLDPQLGDLMRQQDYDNDRHDVISMICAFYKASGE